jgi:hypothetical protein
MYFALVNLLGTLPNTLKSAFEKAWEEYKGNILDQLIIEKHPCVREKISIPQNQLTHIKSAYVVLLADSLGLPNKQAAEGDAHKPKLTLDKTALLKEFNEKIEMSSFVKELCERVNSQTIPHQLVLNYANSQGELSSGFGYYGEDKDYEGVPQATEEQRNSEQPYISFQEVKQVLVEAQILQCEDQ